MNKEAIHQGLAFQKKIKKDATNNDFDDIVTVIERHQVSRVVLWGLEQVFGITEKSRF